MRELSSNSVLAMDILKHLTLNLEILKVKVKDKGHNE